VAGHESLSARLARELPELGVDPAAGSATPWTPTASCSTRRSGPGARGACPLTGDADGERLVIDVGIAGAGSSAEEAAVHLVATTSA
jgi:hypothetical protein